MLKRKIFFEQHISRNICVRIELYELIGILNENTLNIGINVGVL